MSNPNISSLTADPAEHIKVGSLYEIDHSKFPLRFPHHLTSIRLVMVNEKTRKRVSLRYPSVYSLRTYFNHKAPEDANKLPAMDEKYTIGSEVAGEALYRRIPPDEVSENRHSWRFWANVPLFDLVSKKGSPPPWLLARHVEEGVEKSSALKRKRPKVESKNTKKKGKNRAVKNSIDRWSTDRYKLAEVNILKVMKEKGAVVRNPILRQPLRDAARKLIGDTGLLDHLLKHMAGKVGPGGEERFMRRHNADGAMEYWLEKADLVDLRKPGDNPFQYPVVAEEINEIKEDAAELKKEMEETKEEIAQLKKNVEMLSSKKHEDYLVMAATPISSVSSQTMEHDGMLISMKEMYIDLENKKAKIEGQLTEISQSLCAMEEELERSKLQKPTLITGSQELTPPTGTIREGFDKIRRAKEEHTRSEAIQDDRESKIERLKSGFRICKPQGTFLWPDKALSSPHSAISPSSVIAHAQNNSKNQSFTSTTVTTSSTTRATLFNLNDLPENQNDDLILESHSPGRGSYFPRTYHRRRQQSLASPTVIRFLPPAERELRHWRASEKEKGMMI